MLVVVENVSGGGSGRKENETPVVMWWIPEVGLEGPALLPTFFTPDLLLYL